MDSSSSLRNLEPRKNRWYLANPVASKTSQKFELSDARTASSSSVTSSISHKHGNSSNPKVKSECALCIRARAEKRKKRKEKQNERSLMQDRPSRSNAPKSKDVCASFLQQQANKYYNQSTQVSTSYSFDDPDLEGSYVVCICQESNNIE